jgi:hypothetical protein
MTRRNRRKGALLAAMCLALLGAGTFRASAYVDDGNCKWWDVGGFQNNLTICVNYTYGYQSDGDGRLWQLARISVVNGCSWLERDDDAGIITGIKAYAGDDTWPHLPTGSKSLVAQHRCEADRGIWLRGPDKGKMYASLGMHVRVDDWPDKDPVFAKVLDV